MHWHLQPSSFSSNHVILNFDIEPIECAKKELWPTWRHLFPKQTFKFQSLETWTFFASTIYQHLFGRKVSLEVKS